MKTTKKRTLTLAGKVVLSTTIIALISGLIYIQRQNLATAETNLQQIKEMREEVKQIREKTQKILLDHGVKVEVVVDP